jgi:hypothetical protein
MERYADLEMDDESQLDNAVEAEGQRHVPQYPYGLRISLTEAEMAKLGMKSMPKVGDTLHFSAFADVTHAGVTEDAGGVRCRIEMQITHMLAMEDENQEAPGG